MITEENGRRISIIEDENGITISSGGRVIRAANAAELKKKNIKAFELYEKHLGAAAMEGAGGIAAGGDAAGGNAAVELMREQLQKQILENADNPQIRMLLERMLLELDEK